MARKKTTKAPTSTAVEDAAPVSAPAPSTICVALNRAQGILFDLPGGRRVEIAGNAVHLRGHEMGMLPEGGAFGLTHIPAEDWDYIQKTYGKTALFKSGRIFASQKISEAKAQAREKQSTRSGLEPVNPVQTENADEVKE